MIIIIDGKRCECEKGEFLLQVAKRNGIDIPTLCHYDSLPGQGCCRLCIVEVCPIGKDKGKVVVSCVFPIEIEIEVKTNSEKIQRERQVVLTLLAKRAPDSDVIKHLCEKYNVPQIARLNTAQAGKCVLCGLCVKACKELGAAAISTVNRGVYKEINTPYCEPSDVCIGCGSCAYICPTNAIEISQTDTTRTIWGKTFNLIKCKKCGKTIGTVEEVHYSNKKAGLEPEYLCHQCKEKHLADVFAHVGE